VLSPYIDDIAKRVKVDIFRDYEGRQSLDSLLGGKGHFDFLFIGLFIYFSSSKIGLEQSHPPSQEV
jgi:hypothetical protein